MGVDHFDLCDRQPLIVSLQLTAAARPWPRGCLGRLTFHRPAAYGGAAESRSSQSLLPHRATLLLAGMASQRTTESRQLAAGAVGGSPSTPRPASGCRFQIILDHPKYF